MRSSYRPPRPITGIAFCYLQNKFECFADGMTRASTGPCIEQQGPKLLNAYSFKPLQNQREEFK
jgi:hypothetical protein